MHHDGNFFLIFLNIKHEKRYSMPVERKKEKYPLHLDIARKKVVT